MSEDEIIERVNKFTNITVLYGKTYGMTTDDLTEYQQVFKGLLDLYKQEKEKNKKVITYIKEKQKIQYKYALSQIECDKILELLEKEMQY
jgi:dTDP-D-glucose 4,6-dehydratase